MFDIACTWQITTRRNIVKRASEAQQKSDRKSEIACACRRSELVEKSSSPLDLSAMPIHRNVAVGVTVFLIYCDENVSCIVVVEVKKN